MIDPVFRNVRLSPGTINAGFPSTAGDYEERELDINDLVVPHPTSNYFMRVSGDSMTGACIHHETRSQCHYSTCPRYDAERCHHPYA